MFPEYRIRHIRRALGHLYDFQSFLGKGAFASVMLVENRKLERFEAMKILAESYDGDHDFARRFVEEAKLVAALDHPNIAKVFDYGDVDGVIWYSMQYIDGPALRSELDRRGRLPEEDVVRLAVPLLDALFYSHEKGIIHRDVKPANILLSRRGQPFLMDFGIAKVTGNVTQTQTGRVMGTPAYVAPEQARGQPLDGRCDIYGLGTTLFQTLCGRTPFVGQGPVETLFERLSHDAPSPTQLGIPAHPDLEKILMRSLQRSPEDRYPSADAMRLDFLSCFPPELTTGEIRLDYPGLPRAPLGGLGALDSEDDSNRSTDKASPLIGAEGIGVGQGDRSEDPTTTAQVTPIPKEPDPGHRIPGTPSLEPSRPGPLPEESVAIESADRPQTHARPLGSRRIWPWVGIAALFGMLLLGAYFFLGTGTPGDDPESSIAESRSAPTPPLSVSGSSAESNSEPDTAILDTGLANTGIPDTAATAPDSLPIAGQGDVGSEGDSGDGSVGSNRGAAAEKVESPTIEEVGNSPAPGTELPSSDEADSRGSDSRGVDSGSGGDRNGTVPGGGGERSDEATVASQPQSPVVRRPVQAPQILEKASPGGAAAEACSGQEVIIRAQVGEEGEVISSKALTQGPVQCLEAAQATIAEYRFRPALDFHGDPVAASITVNLRFP